MNCYLCSTKAIFVCPCNYLNFCETHLGPHYNLSCEHIPEKLNIKLSDLDSKNLKSAAINKINSLEISKKDILSLCKRLIKKIEANCKIVIQKFDKQISLYSKLMSFQDLSISLKSEVDKMIGSILTVKKISLDIDNEIEKAFSEDIILLSPSKDSRTKIEDKISREAKEQKNKEDQVKFEAEQNRQREIQKKKEKEHIENENKRNAKKVEIPKFRGSNKWPIDEKKLYLESLDIIQYMECFSFRKPDNGLIKEILFSNNGNYAFVCIYYLGIFK